jgi:hypothetical protein
MTAKRWFVMLGQFGSTVQCSWSAGAAQLIFWWWIKILPPCVDSQATLCFKGFPVNRCDFPHS